MAEQDESNLTKEGQRRLDRVLKAFQDLGKKFEATNKRVDRMEKIQIHLIKLLEEEALPDLGELLEEIQALREAAGNPLSPLGQLLREAMGR